MRSDSNLNKEFAAEGVDTRDYGSMPGVLDTNSTVEGRGRVLRSHSFSGHETNSLFYNLGGRTFAEVSGVSGADSIADGRGFAYLDYDRDGWPDIVLVNSNEPQLQLFRNQMGEALDRKAITVRLVGGAGSPVDGYGAHVRVAAGGVTQTRESRCGDGFAIENSRDLHFGLGAAERAETVTVRWPSGKTTEVGAVEGDSLVTVRESDGAAPEITRREAARLSAEKIPEPPMLGTVTLKTGFDGARLRVVTAMATWCGVCLSELPHFAALKENFPDGEVAFYGLPTDPEDDAAKLDAYTTKHTPPYRILSDLPADEMEAVKEYLKARLGEIALPTTLILDPLGQVLLVKKGTVTLSDIRALLAK